MAVAHRRLVWLAVDTADPPGAAFRVAGGGTLATIDAEPYALADDAVVGSPIRCTWATRCRRRAVR
ncbi:hypothetical protein [Micromonospora fluostatini]|uniref:hypothetical protein n=1 Tax=Micromonospora sp. JCM 30529 TaxID=3421643 RepID=UPI003D1688F8